MSDGGHIPQATAALIDLTADSESYVRYRAAEALTNHRSADAAAALIRLLDDEEEAAAKAAESLRVRDRHDVASLVLDWLGPDLEPARFILAAIALEGSSAPAAIEMLTDALSSANAEIRQAAALSLTGSEDGRVISVLIQRLADPSPAVREAVVRALTPAQDPQVVAAMAPALADQAPRVRAAAITALQLSDRHPDLVAPVLSLLADDARNVREAVIQQINKTAMPSVLRWICESTLNVSDLLAIGGSAVKELADRVYRGLSADEQAMVVRRLAAADAQTALTARHAAPDAGPNWSAPGIGKYVSPDLVSDEFLDEIIVILLQGSNMFGTRVYSYLELPGRRLSCMFDAMQAGRNFRPSEYGAVIFAGVGEPPPDVREMTERVYDLKDVPFPSTSAD